MNFTVRSLPPQCSTYDLVDLFRPYGKVSDIRMNSGVGFVTMVNKEEALRAIMPLKNAKIRGREIQVEMEGAQGHYNMPGSTSFDRTFSGWNELPVQQPEVERAASGYNDMKSWNTDMNKQNLPRQPVHEELQPESYVYVDPHGYSRDPTMRPAPEYYYRVKALDRAKKF